jgi:hypothetical protein
MLDLITAVSQTRFSRRRNLRVELNEIYAFWSCEGRDGLSRIRDISVGGLFIEIPIAIKVDTRMTLHFLVKDGQIRADGVVRHAKSGRGLGLKFVAVSEGDRERFAALLRRVRH